MEQQTNGAMGQQSAALAAADSKAAAMQRMERTAYGFQLANMDDAWKVANMLAQSALMPDALKGKPNDVLVQLVTGAELGLGIMQSIREIYVVKGRGYISSLLKVALVKQSSHCKYFRLVESTTEKATFVTERWGEGGPTTMTFTAAEARKAGLLDRKNKDGQIDPESNWQKYTALMLRRRCQNQLCDEVYPDVVRGIGTEDEREEVLATDRESSHRQMPTTTQAPPKPSATLPRLDTPKAKELAREEGNRPLPGFHADATPEEVAEGQRIAEGNRRALSQPLPAPAAAPEPEPAQGPPAGDAPSEGEVLLAEVEAFDPKGRDAADVLAGLRARALKLPKSPERDAVGAALNKAKGLLSGAR